MKLFFRILTSIVIVLASSGNSSAQIFKPVKWNFSVEQKRDEATLIFTADIDKGWHLYAQDIPEGGPIPTSFNLKSQPAFEKIGKTTEGKPIEEFDANFDMKLKYFAKRAIFKQKIKIKSAKDFMIIGTLEFMVCDDKQCLPPEEVDFSFKIKGVPEKVVVDTVKTDISHIEIKDTVGTGIELHEDKITEAAPEEIIPEKPVEKKRSLWGIFIAGFLGGLLALLTPCVFPMLPLTVSYFTKKNHAKSKAIGTALIYGLSIIVIYVGLGFGVTKLLGADALNDLASNAIFNMLFFVLFVVFAASFFGAFEITLPSSWVSNADKQADKGGLMGIFFMAFTLALVSFSCTGPIIGTLLVEAAVGKNALGPVIGMTGFSVALAIPFALFAAFPSWLQSLPRSGGWLNSVKVVLGFLELALAMKFLSNVDLAYHWGILDREVFLVLWIVIFAMLGFYLLGKLRFSHDSAPGPISIPRLFLAIISLSFSLYMVPGLWGAPLKAISAFSPPQATQDFDLHTNAMSGGSHSTAEEPAGKRKYGDVFHCPHGINCYFDYEEGMAAARAAKKPVLIDFTGWSCVNCRKMEVSVWSDPRVLQKLREDYILISLYVDDKTKLPEAQQFESTVFKGKKIKTIGNKWSELQTSRFGINSQPYYVLMDNDGKLLTDPTAFDLDIDKYVSFLEKGITEYKKR